MIKKFFLALIVALSFMSSANAADYYMPGGSYGVYSDPVQACQLRGALLGYLPQYFGGFVAPDVCNYTAQGSAYLGVTNCSPTFTITHEGGVCGPPDPPPCSAGQTQWFEALAPGSTNNLPSPISYAGCEWEHAPDFLTAYECYYYVADEPNAPTYCAGPYVSTGNASSGDSGLTPPSGGSTSPDTQATTTTSTGSQTTSTGSTTSTTTGGGTGGTGVYVPGDGLPSGGTGGGTTSGTGTQPAGAGTGGSPSCGTNSPCRIDETGTLTPAEGDATFKAGRETVTRSKDDAINGINGAGDSTGKNTNWNFTFTLPTSCSVYPLFLSVSIDFCSYQSTIHPLMSMLWVSATIFLIIGMVGKTIRGN